MGYLLGMRHLAFLSLLLILSCGQQAPPKSEPGPQKIRLALNWFPECEHGGYYEALRRGFYAGEGLDVEILPGGPSAPVVQRIATGDVTFGVENADKVIFGRAQGANVRAVFAPIQISPHCIIVHANSGISSLAALRDVSLALSPNAAFAAYLKKKLPMPGVEIIPYAGNVARFLTDPKHAQQGYAFSEPLIAKKSGGDPRVFLIADPPPMGVGFNPYSSLLIADESVVNNQPDLVAKMAKASRRGWEEYLKNPDATNRHINSLNPGMELDILAEGVDILRSMVWTAEARDSGLGVMTSERWQTLIHQMEEAGVLQADAVLPNETFDSRFHFPITAVFP